MANTKKKTDDLDFTNQPQATTKEDVDNQDSRTRTWQNLTYLYNNQLKQSDQSYDKAISNLNNSLLSKGMQRSSYGALVGANMYNQKVEAQNNINAAKIADYQKQLSDIEAQEKEDERYEREFAEKQRQYDESLAFQKSEAERAQANVNREYEANRADTAFSQNYQMQNFNYSKEQDALNRAAQQEQFEYTKAQDAIANAMKQQQMEHQFDQDAIANAYQQAVFGHQVEQDEIANALQREQIDYTKEQNAIEQAFKEKQFEAQVNQWQDEFNYKKMSDSQQMAFDVITRALAAGNDADDATLKRAGISRAEYNSMKAQTEQTGSAGSVTWRQTADAKAKSLGFKGRNDPDYIAYLNGGGSTTTGATTPAQDAYSEFNDAMYGTGATTGKEPVAYGTTALNFKQPVYEGSITVGGKTYSIDEYNKLKAKASK